MSAFLWVVCWACVHICAHTCVSQTALLRAPIRGFFSARLPADKQDMHNGKSALSLRPMRIHNPFPTEAQEGKRTSSPLLPQRPESRHKYSTLSSSNLWSYNFKVIGKLGKNCPCLGEAFAPSSQHSNCPCFTAKKGRCGSLCPYLTRG